MRNIQRLFAKRISRKEELFFLIIPDRKGKLAVQVFGTLLPILVVCLEDNFGVGLRDKLVAEFLKVCPYLLIIEYFAIKDDGVRSLRGRRGRGPGGAGGGGGRARGARDS